MKLFSDGKSHTQFNTLEGGRFSFNGLGAAQYSVRIDENTLPEHVLGPWEQHKNSPGQGNSYQAQKVRVSQLGETHEVELRVFAASVAWGSVQGMDGGPVENADVRLLGSANSGQPSSLMASALTDDSGRFEIRRIYPGRYLVQVFPQLSTQELYRAQPAPIPTPIEILPGGTYELGTLQLGVGENSVTGHVVDESGVPFEGLEVFAYPAGSPGDGFLEFKMNSRIATATTDSDGRYRLDQIPDATIKIHVGADYMEKPLGEAQAAFWIEPQVIQLSGSKEHIALDSVLPRSKPFRIYGTVDLDSEWSSINGVRLGDIRIDVDLLDPSAHPIPNRPSFQTNRIYKPNSSTGSFEILLETPHHPVSIAFTCNRATIREVSESIYDLIPNGEIELTPRFPSSN